MRVRRLRGDGAEPWKPGGGPRSDWGFRPCPSLNPRLSTLNSFHAFMGRFGSARLPPESPAASRRTPPRLTECSKLGESPRRRPPKATPKPLAARRNCGSVSIAETYGEIQVTSATTTEAYATHTGTTPGYVRDSTGALPAEHRAWQEEQRQNAE